MKPIRDGDTLILDMFEPIGYDPFFDDGIASKDVSAALDQHRDATEVVVRLNSPGGYVNEGAAIYSRLKSHSAHVVVEIHGLAASIASVIAMAGDEVKIAETALFMIHEPWSIAIGDQYDFQKEAETLGKHRDSLLSAYSRAELGDDELLAAIRAETWYTADEAVAAGFADSVIGADDDKTKALRSPRAVAMVGRFRGPVSEGRSPILRAAAMARPQPKASLGARTPEPSHEEQDKMTSTILAALGLPKDATEAQALSAIDNLKTERPDLREYVPRSDYETEQAKSAALAKQIEERDAAELDRKIEAAVDKAIADKKVTPPQREQALDMCRKAGVEAFEAFVSTSAPIVSDKPIVPAEPPEAPEGSKAAESRDAAVAKALGMPLEKYRQHVAGHPQRDYFENPGLEG